MRENVVGGRYRLLEPLGKGAMSSVWLADDPELGRQVAVKVLGPTADRERFEREARSAAALSHPNLCQVYDYGESEGRPFMVLEYLPGGTLEDLLREGKQLPDHDTQRIAIEVASGLAHAHDRGLVHRDLKPANVLFDAEGRAKIADFGIARMAGVGTLTEAGAVLGTASYISPEQADGLPATPASDVYSFGVMLFRMLSGQLPFRSQNAMELVRMHRDEPPPAVAEVRPDAPPRLAGLADASLGKDPSRRPANGAALLAALTGASTDATTILAPPAEAAAATQVLPPPARRRSPWPLVLAGLLLLLIAGVAAALVATNDDGSDGSSPPASLTLPTIPPHTTTTAPTEPATTQPTTTAPTTTTRPTTTQPTTTAPTTVPTTARTTTAPTTTQAPTTTTAPAPTTTETTLPTTAPTTTETLPTTTEPVPTTTETTPTTTPTTTEPVTTAGGSG